MYFNPLRYNYKNNLPSSSPVVKVIVIVTVFFAAFHVVYMRPNIYICIYIRPNIYLHFSLNVQLHMIDINSKVFPVDLRIIYLNVYTCFTLETLDKNDSNCAFETLDQSQQLRLILVLYYDSTLRICFNDIFQTIFKH